MTLQFREPSQFDISYVAERMAYADLVECRAHGLTPYRALQEAVDTSVLAWTGAVNGLPQALFGVSSISLVTGWGRPWFLGTSRARKEARAFLKIAPLYLERISAIFPRLDNYVHRDNAAAIGWLRKMGFVIETEVLNFGGEPMLHFHKGF